jgi:lysophospholipase L1-like esterase
VTLAPGIRCSSHLPWDPDGAATGGYTGRRGTRRAAQPDRKVDTTRTRTTSLLVVPALMMAGLGLASASTPVPTPVPTPGTLHVLAVGDSITEADSDDFDDAAIGPSSWATSTDGNGVQVLGGWAHAGATTEDMLQGLADRQPGAGASPATDVLVIMAGNNDVDASVPFDVVADNLVAIAGTVDPGRVVLSVIAPEDEVAEAVSDFNARLPGLAARQGWQLVDPMGGVGDGRGHYLPGMSDDGVHPTAEGARLIGATLRAALIS